MTAAKPPAYPVTADMLTRITLTAGWPGWVSERPGMSMIPGMYHPAPSARKKPTNHLSVVKETA